MGLGKQAKTLTKGQVDAVQGYLAKTRWPTRNRLIFLLSVKAGLRAKEIASLSWRMVTDAGGQIGQGDRDVIFLVEYERGFSRCQVAEFFHVSHPALEIIPVRQKHIPSSSWHGE